MFDIYFWLLALSIVVMIVLAAIIQKIKGMEYEVNTSKLEFFLGMDIVFVLILFAVCMFTGSPV